VTVRRILRYLGIIILVWVSLYQVGRGVGSLQAGLSYGWNVFGHGALLRETSARLGVGILCGWLALKLYNSSINPKRPLR
jgi:hypothetical protein